uniref:AAA+ ATPase domain-containing protein n=2 Tax=Guillardia theta TaxID=55529 RepID=A0A7S4K1Y9_GUITH|mmetsp:Transcript_20454/g.68294  ORF Transcript_20454/g.68294 Transcript_20454/m.68294 type:complete len:447 (+) Transcript_20454:133-1473(+)
MENNRKRLVVIMAGYTREMADFMRSNSGLESRFPLSFEFPNYSYSEMAQIFRVMARARKLHVAVEEEKLVELITSCIPRSVASKGNARAVRNLLDKVLSRQTDRVADSGTSSMDSLLTLVEKDFPTSSSAGGADGSEEGSTSDNGGLSPGGLEDILKQLDEIVGVVEVKQIFRSLRAKVTIAAERRSLGLPADGASSLHMIFQGNPGTGKTTVARLMGKMFKAVQMIHTGHLVEVSRVDLVGQHVGETAPKTRRVVESAVGGVLFVDEAYSLVSDSKDSFGREALDTIMKCMEDMRDELVVVLAGYPKEMQSLLETNPGLRSRFPVTVNFPDYSSSELVEIADKMLAARQCQLSDEARRRLVLLCDAQVALNDPMSGNARFVRNLLEIACMRQAERLLKLPKRTREQLMTLEGEDFSAFTEKEFEGTGVLLAEEVKRGTGGSEREE